MLKYLAFFTILFFCEISGADAEPVSFGGPPIEEGFNALSSKHVFAKVIVDSSVYPLLRFNGASPQMLLAKASKFTEKEWFFRLGEDLKFSSRQPVNLSDVIWSLNRCKRLGLFQEVEVFSWKAEERTNLKWLIMSFAAKPDFNKVMREISDCPVLEEKSSSAFGEDLGYGTNLVSSGRYLISNFKEGRTVTLKLFKPEVNVKRIDELELRGIGNPEEGLSLLRSGTLLIFFTENASILEKSKTDPTLKTGTCSGYNYAARADLNYDCTLSFDISSIL